MYLCLRFEVLFHKIDILIGRFSSEIKESKFFLKWVCFEQIIVKKNQLGQTWYFSIKKYNALVGNQAKNWYRKRNFLG